MNTLFVAWRPTDTLTGWRPVGRLEHDGSIYRFAYTRGAKRESFRPFTGMPDLGMLYESDELFPLFANRLLSNSRPEYDAYLRWSGFDPTHPPDPIVVLGVTEGLRQTDAVEVFPCPVPNVDSYYTNRFFLHGIRWMASATIDRIGSLEIEEPLRLMLDVQNTFDPNAVALRTEKETTIVGYVPRYLARDVRILVEQCDPRAIQLSVVRVNRDAPLENRLLCQMKASWPAGFRPCSGDDFTPIRADVSAEFAR